MVRLALPLAAAAFAALAAVDALQLLQSPHPSPWPSCKLHKYAPKTLPACTSEGDDSLFGYFFLFFKDDTEQINAGLSLGNDPLKYTLYNDGTSPILSSTVGTKHTRDPYLVRSKDKSKNWIIATDNTLKGQAGQDQASRQITIYESEDGSLSKWKPSRLSPPLAGSWSGGVSAPEAYWDEKAGKFFVIFGSTRFEQSDPDHTAKPGPSSIYYTGTSDFITFDQPKLYYSIPNGGLSDMTIASLGKPGAFVRFFRDDTGGVLKVRGQITYDGLFGQWNDIGSDKSYVSDDGANGGPLLFPDNLNKDLWHIWIDEFTGGYKPFETEDIGHYGYKLSNAPSFPKDLKQGCVVPLSKKEYNELRSAKF